MEGTRDAFFDPQTVAILRNVLDDAWSSLPALWFSRASENNSVILVTPFRSQCGPVSAGWHALNHVKGVGIRLDGLPRPSLRSERATRSMTVSAPSVFYRGSKPATTRS